MYFHLKRGLWITEKTVQFFFSLAQVDASDDVSVSEVAW